MEEVSKTEKVISVFPIERKRRRHFAVLTIKLSGGRSIIFFIPGHGNKADLELLMLDIEKLQPEFTLQLHNQISEAEVNRLVKYSSCDECTYVKLDGLLNYRGKMEAKIEVLARNKAIADFCTLKFPKITNSDSTRKSDREYVLCVNTFRNGYAEIYIEFEGNEMDLELFREDISRTPEGHNLHLFPGKCPEAFVDSNIAILRPTRVSKVNGRFVYGSMVKNLAKERRTEFVRKALLEDGIPSLMIQKNLSDALF